MNFIPTLDIRRFNKFEILKTTLIVKQENLLLKLLMKHPQNNSSFKIFVYKEFESFSHFHERFERFFVISLLCLVRRSNEARFIQGSSHKLGSLLSLSIKR